MEHVAALAADGTITPHQLAEIVQRFAQGDSAVLESVAPLMSLRASMPAETFTATIRALLQKSAVCPGAEEVRNSPADAEANKVTPEGESTTNDSTPCNADTKHDDPAARETLLPTEEVVMICVDVSGSMRTPFEPPEEGIVPRTRLDSVKQMFYGFRDQTQTYTERKDCRHMLGLISYDDMISVHTTPTFDFDVFEDVVDDMKCKGRTAIYEAVARGAEALQQQASGSPPCDLRVLILTDGQNNCTKVSAEGALQSLNSAGAICDAIIVGDSPDGDLLRLVAATDGCAWKVNTLSDAFETLESEAVISLRARRGGAALPVKKDPVRKSLGSVAPAAVGVGCVRASQQPTTASYAPFTPDMPGRHKAHSRITKDLIGLGDLAEYDCLEADLSVSCARIRLRGAVGTPYAKGSWLVSMRFPENYPFQPPRIQLETPIYHYAVSTDGTLCLPILVDHWAPAVTLQKVLAELQKLIMKSEEVDPRCDLSLRSWQSELKRVNPGEYNAEAAKHTAQHAA